MTTVIPDTGVVVVHDPEAAHEPGGGGFVPGGVPGGAGVVGVTTLVNDVPLKASAVATTTVYVIVTEPPTANGPEAVNVVPGAVGPVTVQPDCGEAAEPNVASLNTADRSSENDAG